MPDEKIHGILTVRSGALGDFILTLPVLRALREAFPASRLILAGRPVHAFLAAPWVDAVEDLDAAHWAPLFAPEAEPGPSLRALLTDIDLAVSFLPDTDGLFARNLERSGVSRVVSHDPRPPTDGSRHITDHLLLALEPLGISPTDRIPHVSPSDDARASLRGRIDLPAEYAVLHPGSGGPAKCWPPDRFAEVAAALAQKGLPAVLTSGPADRDLVSRVLSAAGSSPIPAPELSLPELAALLAGARIFIGNDSGPGHMAAAVGAPVVSIFGPTDPRTWSPRGERIAVVTAPGNAAPDARLSRISPETVLDAALALLG